MATGRLAVLSNVNMNMVIRMLQKQAEVYDAEGYGNELGALLNPASSYHAFQPDITFLIMDLAEFLIPALYSQRDAVIAAIKQGLLAEI